MTTSSHHHTPRRAGWVALAVLLFAAPGAANAQGLFSMFGGDRGGPSSFEIERELAASGYELTGPMILRGDVYVADVIVRGEGPERLIVDPESGRVLQRFRTRGDRWREAAAPPDAWSDDPHSWNGPRPPADISPGAPPPDNWLRSAPAVTGPVVIEPPKTAPRKVEAKPKPNPAPASTPVANVANPPVIQSSPAATVKPAPALVKPAAEPSPAASAAPAPSPSPSLQAVKADAQSAPVKAPASAPTPAKTKSVNDIPVTPLD